MTVANTNGESSQAKERENCQQEVITDSQAGAAVCDLLERRVCSCRISAEKLSDYSLSATFLSYLCTNQWRLSQWSDMVLTAFSSADGFVRPARRR
jgi:hypothetical protein